MSAYAVETRALTKRFGEHTALDRLDLTVPAGSVFGFLGPNGAGKTTTLRMLVGLARPTAGDALILGVSILDPGRTYLRHIGYLPDVPGFYDWMRARDFLALTGEIYGLAGRDLRARIDEVLDLTGLADVKTRIGGFSRGMKQRLGLAQALMNRPGLLFLDEPTSALDPIGRKDVLETIARLAGRTTVFFSTHILADVERVCDTVAILKEGRLVTERRIDDLRASYAARLIYLEFEGSPDLEQLLGGQSWAGRIRRSNDGWLLEPRDLPGTQRLLPGFIGGHGLALRRFELVEPSLEDIFMRLVNGK